MARRRVDTIACVILMVAAREGKVSYRNNTEALFNTIFHEFIAVKDTAEIHFSEFEKAIDVLREAGLARSSPEDDFIDRFHRIDHSELVNLISEADREHHAFVKRLEEGAISALSHDTPTEDFLRVHPMLRHYADFGDNWLKSQIAKIPEEVAAPTDKPTLEVLDAETVANLQSQVVVVRREINLADISNEDRAFAIAYVDAIDALLTAPEPDRELIWKILDRANAMAGIAGFFLALFAVLK